MPVNLWEIIRNFFVVYVFGGHDSHEHVHEAFLGLGFSGADGSMPLYNQSFGLPISGHNILDDTSVEFMSIGDWLSTTATIITLCLLLFAVFLAIKFLFKLVAGSFLKIGE